MSGDLVVVTQLLDGAPETSPFLAEKIAIDATNALRSAEIGLRSFRARPLLRRLWEGARGASQERIATFGYDLVVAQQALLSYVETVMTEEARTQYCVNRVLINLQAVNRDLDALDARTNALEEHLNNSLASTRAELRQLILKESRRLAAEIEAVHFLVQREASLRRIAELYKAGELHKGTGLILNSALYLVSVAHQFMGDRAALQQREWAAALALVKQVLGNQPGYIPDLVSQDVTEIGDMVLEAMAYVTFERQGPILFMFNGLVERRMADLHVDESSSEEMMKIALKLHDPEQFLKAEVVRPWKLVEQIAKELLFSQEEMVK